MIKFCVIHNGICYNDRDWHFPEENIEIILRAKQKLASMEKCPMCTSTAKRVEEFLKRNYNRR